MGSAVKSAAGILKAPLLGSKDVTEGEALSVSDEPDTDVEKEARHSQWTTGQDSPCADEDMEEPSPAGINTDATAEGWSVVGRFPEDEGTPEQAQSESELTSVEGQEETPSSDDSNSCMQAGSGANDPVLPHSALRRRPRSSSKRTSVSFVGGRISPFSESVDIAAIAESPAAFDPGKDSSLESSGETAAGSGVGRNDADCASNADNSTGSMRRKPWSTATGRIDNASRSSLSIDVGDIAERPEASEPQYDPFSGALRNTEVETQLQDEDVDYFSKIDSSNDLGRRARSEFPPRYDSELENDDSDVSSASSREADDVTDGRKSGGRQEEEGWEEVASSSDLEGKKFISETGQRTEVYTVPASDAEREKNREESLPEVLVQPAGFVVRAIEFQLNLIVHMIAIGIWLVNFTLFTIAHPICRVGEVKDKVTGTINQVLGVFSFLRGGISQAGPAVGKLSKKTVWGCLSVAYVIFMLGLLLIPAVFVDIIVLNSLVEKPLVIQKPLDFDFTQPIPVASLPLFPPKEIERINKLPLEKAVKSRVVPLGSKFVVTLTLTLPESDYNMKLGMFQVTAELLSARNQVTFRSSKPCRLRYRSFPIQLVRTFIYAVPHLFGLSKEAQIVVIRLLEAQEKAVPTAAVRILIEPKARFRDETGVPEIYEAAVRLESTLSWPRALISKWKWLLFLWNGTCLLLFEVAIVLCCCRKVLIPSFGQKSVSSEEVVIGELKEEMARTEAAREKRSSRKGRRTKRVYFEDDLSTIYSRLDEYEDN